MAFPAAAAAGASATSSLLDFAGSSIMANSANAKSKRAVMLQYALQNALMDKQNEYNKPINQMARLREAGLNPNLVYGDGGATMASASAGTPSAPDITPASGTFGLLGKMQALNAMKQQDANIKETEARTSAIDENIELKRQELELRREDIELQRQMVASQIGLRGVQSQKASAETKYLENKSPVTLSDPVGYATYQANNIYDSVHDATLRALEHLFGKRNVYYAKGR